MDPFELSTQMKLELAQHWARNGHEDLARNIISSLVDAGMAAGKISEGD